MVVFKGVKEVFVKFKKVKLDDNVVDIKEKVVS